MYQCTSVEDNYILRYRRLEPPMYRGTTVVLIITQYFDTYHVPPVDPCAGFVCCPGADTVTFQRPYHYLSTTHVVHTEGNSNPALHWDFSSGNMI